MRLTEQQSRALFVIGSAVVMMALVLIPSVLVYIYS